MNRIDTTIAQLQANSKKVLSPYITAGDPEPKLTVELLHAMVRGGANILELGIPFSDPMAEGPVIQRAMERALSYSMNTPEVLQIVKKFREQDTVTPIIIMGYVNPIEHYGYERFAKDAREAGVDGTILVDLPPEESAEVSAIWEKHGLYSIYLCSPTTSEERMQRINQLAKGYLYYVSLKGVTGADTLDMAILQEQYQQRKAQTNLPLLVGFGIKNPEMAAQVAAFADGVIVGAALITRIDEAYQANKNCLEAGTSLMSSMRQAMDMIK